MRSLSDLTSKAAVQAALDEFIGRGRGRFLLKYGFGRSRNDVVVDPRTGTEADAKAIAGAAVGYQYPDSGPLRASAFSGGDATVASCLQALGFSVQHRTARAAGEDWGRDEVELIVADYLSMLTKELSGQRYSKTAHRQHLLGLLPHRSTGSIEFKLGLAGELFAVDFERWRLAKSGADQLADKVRHVSRDEGDGLGYDVLSFEPDGSERFIEVKTTSFGERTPFFVSANEVQFARTHTQRFRLYRLFDFRVSPRLFELAGSFEQHCQLDPTTFRASFG